MKTIRILANLPIFVFKSFSLLLSCFTLILFLSANSCEPDENSDDNLDTTSHNFIWDIDTLGEYGSYLLDVAIIDENNVWAVGEIREAGEKYNASHWDGSEWELIRIENTYGQVIKQNAVFGFTEDDVWTGEAGVKHWNGSIWSSYGSTNSTWDFDGRVQKIWGTSSSNLYFVGGNGSIVHYNGTTFTKMESETELNLLDVYGNEEKVFATGHSNGHESIALEYDGTQWTTKFFSERLLPGEGSNFLGRFYSVWVHEDTVYIVAKAGIWKESLSTGEGILLSNSKIKITDQVTKRIRGNNYNDFFLADIWGEMIHYNGSTWYLDQTIYNQYPGGQVIITSMDFKDNLCVAVGYMGNTAVIIMGNRIE